MAWIRLTNTRTGRPAYYNTDNLVEIAADGAPGAPSGTRLAAIAAAGNPFSIDTMNYHVREELDDVMARIAAVGVAVAG